MANNDANLGLSEDILAGMLPSTGRKEQGALKMLREHLSEAFTGDLGYVAWSGGKDSTAALLLALAVNPKIPVVFFDSGLEFPETLRYIKDIQGQWELNLYTIKSDPDAFSLLEKTGAWTHDPNKPYDSTGGSLHRALITTPSKTAHKHFGMGEITGLRAGESAPRRILLAPKKGVYTRLDGARVCAPLWNWTERDVESLINRKLAPINPVYSKLRKLGAPKNQQRAGLVFDGNALEWGRATWLRLGWPELWAEITQRLPRVSEWR